MIKCNYCESQAKYRTMKGTPICRKCYIDTFGIDPKKVSSK